MIQMRCGVFETNSSSTHSICICPKETYDEWLEGKLLYDDWSNKFVEGKKLTTYDYAQAREKYEACKGKYYKSWDELSDEDRKEYTTTYVLETENNYGQYLTYLEWCSQHATLCKYSEHYKTKSGDEIVAFGYYGYDG